MLKEMFMPVSKSFQLNVGEIKNPQVISDAAEIGKRKAAVNYTSIIPSYGLPDFNLGLQLEMIEKEKERILEEHKNDSEYIRDFNKVCSWNEKDFWGKRTKFLESLSEGKKVSYI